MRQIKIFFVRWLIKTGRFQESSTETSRGSEAPTNHFGVEFALPSKCLMRVFLTAYLANKMNNVNNITVMLLLAAASTVLRCFDARWAPHSGGKSLWRSVVSAISAMMRIWNTCKFFLCKVSGKYSSPHLPSPKFSHPIKKLFSWWNYPLFPKPFLAVHNQDNLNEILEILPPSIPNNRAFSDFRIKVLRGTLINHVIKQLVPTRIPEFFVPRILFP